MAARAWPPLLLVFLLACAGPGPEPALAPPIPASTEPQAAPATGRPAEMAFIAGGPFLMGSDDGPEDERPAHEVRLAPFLIDRLPVTNAQFAEFLNAVGPRNSRGENLYDIADSDARIHAEAGRYRADSGFEHHPVVEPSWAGARDYCAWRGARLPTEAEWERAARGAEGRPYPWGVQSPSPSLAHFAARYNDYLPAGSKPEGATPEGVQDMAGNVWQWVSSLYRPYPYRANDGREDPDGPGERVTRGGGHDSPAAHLRGSYRGRGLSRGPGAGHHNIGFRCATDG